MGKFKVGKHTYGDINILFRGTVHCGAFCQIAGNVTAIMEGHRIDNVSSYPFTGRHFQHIWGSYPLYGRVTNGDVRIGNDVWIGYGVTLLSGAVIGDGAIIGAGAVVRSHVKPYSIVIGNPAKLLRMRFTIERINKLLELNWWNWPDEKIKNNLDLIMYNDVDELYRRNK